MQAVFCKQCGFWHEAGTAHYNAVVAAGTNLERGQIDGQANAPLANQGAKTDAEKLVGWKAMSAAQDREMDRMRSEIVELRKRATASEVAALQRAVWMRCWSWIMHKVPDSFVLPADDAEKAFRERYPDGEA